MFTNATRPYRHLARAVLDEAIHTWLDRRTDPCGDGRDRFLSDNQLHLIVEAGFFLFESRDPARQLWFAWLGLPSDVFLRGPQARRHVARYHHLRTVLRARLSRVVHVQSAALAS